MKYRYLVIVRGDKLSTPSTYFPSNSRDSIKHMLENNGTYCWVYDKDGWWLSHARRDSKTGKAYHAPMFPDGEPRRRYAVMLAEFNRKEKEKCLKMAQK
jgi:hypothetical protein